jgi:hypothetical protein
VNTCDPLAMSDLLHQSACTHKISDDTIWQNNPVVGMTKRSYMEAVMAGFNTDSIAFNRIYVRLILSIDRQETTEAAIETENFSTCSDFGERDGPSTGSTLWRSVSSISSSLVLRCPAIYMDV